jgi:hypothetical protein
VLIFRGIGMIVVFYYRFLFFSIFIYLFFFVFIIIFFVPLTSVIFHTVGTLQGESYDSKKTVAVRPEVSIQRLMQRNWRDSVVIISNLLAPVLFSLISNSWRQYWTLWS